jgi:hypothetical protein
MVEKKPISHKDYIKSAHWRKTSKKILDDPQVVCALCSRPRWDVWKRGSAKKKKKPGDKKRLRQFNVHHTSYANLGTPAELDDLLPLCVMCHDTAHVLERLSRFDGVWLKLYAQLLSETKWAYEKTDVYQVPLDFKEPVSRKK